MTSIKQRSNSEINIYFLGLWNYVLCVHISQVYIVIQKENTTFLFLFFFLIFHYFNAARSHFWKSKSLISVPSVREQCLSSFDLVVLFGYRLICHVSLAENVEHGFDWTNSWTETLLHKAPGYYSAVSSADLTE